MVILSSDGINDSPRPWLLGIELRERDPGDLLAIPVADRGWAYAGDLTRLYRVVSLLLLGTVAALACAGPTSRITRG